MTVKSIRETNSTTKDEKNNIYRRLLIKLEGKKCKQNK